MVLNRNLQCMDDKRPARTRHLGSSPRLTEDGKRKLTCLTDRRWVGETGWKGVWWRWVFQSGLNDVRTA